VRFLLSEPLLLLPGDRFIIRKFSPVVTIGGGVVVDINSPPRMRRAELAVRTAKLDRGSPAERIELLVTESAHGVSIAELVARTGLLAAEIQAIAAAGRFVYLREPHNLLVSRPWAEQKLARIRSILQEFHRKNPLLPGVSREELRSREFAGAPDFLFDALLPLTKDIASEGNILRLAAHRVAPKQDEEEALGRMEALFQRAGLTVPSVSEVMAKSGIDASRARSLLQVLLKSGRLVRVSEDLIFHYSALDKLRRLLAPRKGQHFSVSDFKDWTGLSRKYAIPLLEFLDRERLTRRDGEMRIVL
jgi:selenocysteine-specific elongation factor